MTTATKTLAQDGHSTPEERARRWDEWMKQELALVPQQEEPIHAINLKYAQLNEDLKRSEDSRRNKLQELKARNADKEKELKTVLTTTQYNVYLEKKKNMQKQMVERMRQ